MIGLRVLEALAITPAGMDWTSKQRRGGTSRAVFWGLIHQDFRVAAQVVFQALSDFGDIGGFGGLAGHGSVK